MRTNKNKLQRPTRPPDPGPRIGPTIYSIFAGTLAGIIAGLILLAWWTVSLIIQAAH